MRVQGRVSRKFDLTFPVSLSLLYDLHPIPPTFLVSFSSSSAPSRRHLHHLSPSEYHHSHAVDSLISAFATKLSTALALKHASRLESTATTILHRISPHEHLPLTSPNPSDRNLNTHSDQRSKRSRALEPEHPRSRAHTPPSATVPETRTPRATPRSLARTEVI